MAFGPIGPALSMPGGLDYPPSLDRVRKGERAWANLDVLHRELFERWRRDLAFPRRATRN